MTLTSTPSGTPLTNYGTRIEVAVESIEGTITRADFAALPQDLSQAGVMGGTVEAIEAHYADGTHQASGTNAQLASDRFQIVEQAVEAAVPASVTTGFESQMDAYFEGAQW
ncbi:MAG: hypothetical protein PHR15_06420 [Atopobiaceae bacterium]|nr:hypothetical protein [Atopobiaceae bacterium]MCH4180696.1 hypothetical protein [Atopobiaceae bacterium]MCH4214713.1 hypothetical protein [Atopobiaceae bacterium]MCH4229881.1 hypothetical protein [Atopobiaceae bacterium]MCH4276759.1 hypothetical protein [Atopobiaceae bacterium]